MRDTGGTSTCVPAWGVLPSSGFVGAHAKLGCTAKQAKMGQRKSMHLNTGIAQDVDIDHALTLVHEM